MESIEPLIVDHLQLQLTGGAQGYKVHLKHVEIYGTSNFTVQNLKLADNGRPFELTVYIPKLTIKAAYSSSGVLIIIPASGGGDFAAIFGEGKGQKERSTNSWTNTLYTLCPLHCRRCDGGD